MFKKNYQKKVNGIMKLFNFTLTKLMKFQQEIQSSRNKIRVKVENLKKDDELLEKQESNIENIVNNINEIIAPKKK